MEKEIEKSSAVPTAGMTTKDSVIVKEKDVRFDAQGRAIIEDREANRFIKETLAAEGAIEIGAPGRAGVTNVGCNSGPNCGTINVYCPPK